jgi:hypothetical protein
MIIATELFREKYNELTLKYNILVDQYIELNNLSLHSNDSLNTNEKRPNPPLKLTLQKIDISDEIIPTIDDFQQDILENDSQQDIFKNDSQQDILKNDSQQDILENDSQQKIDIPNHLDEPTVPSHSVIYIQNVILHENHHHYHHSSSSLLPPLSKTDKMKHFLHRITSS